MSGPQRRCTLRAELPRAPEAASTSPGERFSVGARANTRGGFGRSVEPQVDRKRTACTQRIDRVVAHQALGRPAPQPRSASTRALAAHDNDLNLHGVRGGMVDGAGRWCEAARLTRSDSSRRMPEWSAVRTFVPGVFPAPPSWRRRESNPRKVPAVRCRRLMPSARRRRHHRSALGAPGSWTAFSTVRVEPPPRL
jgi:hypothetical protein